MNYYIEFPIDIKCNLQCSYCFHQEAFNLDKENRRHEKYHSSRPFSIDQYKSWRDKYLTNGDDYLMELHGGECSHPDNQQDVLNIIDTMDKERFQLQTNGLGDEVFYKALSLRKDKIDRIGFTFHRDVIAHNQNLVQKYIDNVMLVKSFGIKVYVKELLIVSKRKEILENKKYWFNNGVEFRIQDFKGYGRGLTHEEYKNYTALDLLLIHQEYKHNGDTCACRRGYKNVIIRGFDIFAGDVIACWNDPTVIGNINEDWYNPEYQICRVNGEIDVKVKEKIYRGTYPKDMWSVENEKNYKELKIGEIER